MGFFKKAPDDDIKIVDLDLDDPTIKEVVEETRNAKDKAEGENDKMLTNVFDLTLDDGKLKPKTYTLSKEEKELESFSKFTNPIGVVPEYTVIPTYGLREDLAKIVKDLPGIKGFAISPVRVDIRVSNGRKDSFLAKKLDIESDIEMKRYNDKENHHEVILATNYAFNIGKNSPVIVECVLMISASFEYKGFLTDADIEPVLNKMLVILKQAFIGISVTVSGGCPEIKAPEGATELPESIGDYTENYQDCVTCITKQYTKRNLDADFLMMNFKQNLSSGMHF